MCAAELALPVIQRALDAGGLTPQLAREYDRSWALAFRPAMRRARWLGRLFERPRLAGPMLGLLGGPGRAWTPRLVSATRTGGNRSI